MQTIWEAHKQLLNKKITAVELVNTSLNAMSEHDDLNAAVLVFKKRALAAAQKIADDNVDAHHYLKGIPYIAKDNFCIKDTVTTASTNILKNYVPPYNATVIRLLNAAGAIPVCKAALDELGMGGNGLQAATGHVLNPWNHKHITGGSSSGSAALVSAGVAPFALGTDTGDSIRKPASYCGLVGWKPSYGLISRAGVIPYAPSLDTVGVLARSVKDVAIVTDCLAKYDKDDFTSVINRYKDSYLNNLTRKIKNQRWCYIGSLFKKMPQYMQDKYHELFRALRAQGVVVEAHEFDAELLKAVPSVYKVISYSESISTHFNLTGLTFGERYSGADYVNSVINSRSNYLGREVTKRFIVGSYCLQTANQKELFLKAQQIRHLITKEYAKFLTNYDGVIGLASPGVAPTINEVMKGYDSDPVLENLLILNNFNGSPSLTLPVGFHKGLPFGINISSLPFNEQKVLNLGYLIEEITQLKNLWIGNRHGN